MSKNFVAARDALQVWDNLKDTVNARSAFTRDNHINHEDYGFITPTIIGDQINCTSDR